jgi:protein required for attachment to host cells
MTLPELFVVVADSTRATTYALKSANGRLVQQSTMQSPAVHKHERDLGTDRAGRVVNRLGGVQHSLGARHGLKQQAAAAFLRSLADSISARLNTTDESLILIAAPRVLGALKASLPDKTISRLHCQVPRDLVDAPALVLQERVRNAASKGWAV